MLDATEAERFTFATFNAVLGRDPVADELEHYAAHLQIDLAPSAMLELLRATPEFLQVRVDTEAAEHFVRDLFGGVFRREPSREESGHLVSAIANGQSYQDVLTGLLRTPEFKDASKVKLFVPPGHFYSPVADPAEAETHLARFPDGSIPAALPDIALDRNKLGSTWLALLPSLTQIPFTAETREGFRYKFNNSNYSWGDGSILHAMLRTYKPSRVVEIGSGWSSVCMVDTAVCDPNLQCAFTFIEPYPQLLKQLLDGRTLPGLTIIDSPVQSVPLDLFKALQPGDFLVIDSSHVARTGSDVCYELFDILPNLASGVFVHIHDMFWPFEYPRTWAVEENRSWNEIYLVRALLANSDAWQIVMFNDWMRRYEPGRIRATYPDFLKNPGSALWLQKR